MGNLPGLKQGIDRDQDGAGRRNAETRDDGFEALFEIDRDPLASGQTQPNQAAGTLEDCLVQLAVGQMGCAIGQGYGIRRGSGRMGDELVQQEGIRHPGYCEIYDSAQYLKAVRESRIYNAASVTECLWSLC